MDMKLEIEWAIGFENRAGNGELGADMFSGLPKSEQLKEKDARAAEK